VSIRAIIQVASKPRHGAMKRKRKARQRAHLRSLDIERLYMCGALTKACVMFTANSAFTLGFEVCVVGDCCADRSREHHDAVLSTYDGYHIAVVQSADVFPSAPPAAARL